VWLALFVTGLWSSSWVLIKFGLPTIPALTFAGLRYAGAALVLLPWVVLSAGRRADLARWDRRNWGRVALLGVLYYAVTQGAQFAGLELLPAAAVSLMLNFTPILVALLSAGGRTDRPTGRQWWGIAVNLAGVALYFLPVRLTAGQWLGLGIMAVGTLANALSSVLGRQINREAGGDALTITAVSMTMGAALLLFSGVAAQGGVVLGIREWGIVAWLALVNTAVAFTLWNHTLRSLTATESSLINSTMLPQIAVLAWVFLGEEIRGKEGLGLALAVLGVVLVQRR
jgi:drug/metabolite transporter (DMT)-like permease